MQAGTVMEFNCRHYGVMCTPNVHSKCDVSVVAHTVRLSRWCFAAFFPLVDFVASTS